MSNNEYREPQERAREFGLKARQEQRLENATYTAAEVKVLAADACKFAYALGRQDALTEIADEMSAEQDDPRIGYVTLQTDHGTWRTLLASRTASQLPQDATSGRTDPGDPNG